jgi:tetratricopeptide (TPR) repeat protein
LAHNWYSYFLSFVERKFDTSIQEARIAAEQLEPLAAISHHVLSMMYINAGRFEEGLEESKLAIELDENSFPGYRGLGICLAELKKYEESIDALKSAVRLADRHPWPLVELCWVYSLSGNLPEVQKIFNELTERMKTEFISGLFMSGAAYFSKNYDKAFEFLKIAFTQRDGSLPCIKTWPLCAFIREDPRFQPFLTKMNFPE